MALEIVTLTGGHVRLEPLTLGHLCAFCEVGLDERVWQWNPSPRRTPEAMAADVETS